MDAQYKMITKTAHLIAKESPQEEANAMFTTMSRLKEQLSKVGKYLTLPCAVRRPCYLEMLLALLPVSFQGCILDWSTNHTFEPL